MPNYLPNLSEVASFTDKAIWKHPDHEQDEEIVLDSGCSFPVAAGQALGKVLLTGRFKEYNNGHSDGTEIMLGILNETVDSAYVGSTIQHVQATMGCSGTAYEAACIGVDAPGKADCPRIKFV